MIRLRATREVYYASKTRNTGDEFEASESDAKLLVGIGKAEYVQEEKKPEPPKQLETRALKAEEPSDIDEKPAPEEPEAEVTPRRGRRYMRRDMQAKE